MKSIIYNLTLLNIIIKCLIFFIKSIKLINVIAIYTWLR